MKFWMTPAGAAIVVGVVMALVSLLGYLPSGAETYVALPILALFAFWLSRWVRYRIFGPAVWLGALLTMWVPILHTMFLPTYLSNHSGWSGATTRGAFFGQAVLAAVVSTLVLAVLASVLAIGPRRRDQARIAEEAARRAANA